MPIPQQLVARESARFAESKPRFDAAFVLIVAVVIENAMNLNSAHFAHGAVGKNSRVFDRDVSLIVEAICHPPTQ